jgi:hypothetical protein
MSNNITGITQEEFEPKILLNVNLTTAVSYVDTLLVSQFPKKKLLQITMFRRVAPPSPEKKRSQFSRATIVVPPKSSPFYAKSRPSPMETRKRLIPSNPRRKLDNLNILPLLKCPMTARRVLNWHTHLGYQGSCQ